MTNELCASIPQTNLLCRFGGKVSDFQTNGLINLMALWLIALDSQISAQLETLANLISIRQPPNIAPSVIVFECLVPNSRDLFLILTWKLKAELIGKQQLVGIRFKTVLDNI